MLTQLFCSLLAHLEDGNKKLLFGPFYVACEQQRIYLDTALSKSSFQLIAANSKTKKHVLPCIYKINEWHIFQEDLGYIYVRLSFQVG